MCMLCGIQICYFEVKLMILKVYIKDFWYTIFIFDLDLVWRMQLLIIKG